MITCRHCHVGHLHQHSATYANWHSGQFVIVPNLPVWQCDVCAQCTVEADVMSRLLPLLGPVTRPNLARPTAPPLPAPADLLADEVDPYRDRRGA